MASLATVPQPTIDDDIDFDRSLELWVHKCFERNPDLARKINLVYQFNIKLKTGLISTWILDLSDGSGALYREPKGDIKCVVTIAEEDFLKALVDKRHWNTLFIKRKMGLKGSRVALEKLQQFWVEADNCNPEFKFICRHSDSKSVVDRDQLKEFACNGFKSDILFHTLKNRMHEEEDIVRRLSGIIEFDITKRDKKSVWTIDFTKSLGQNVYPGPPKLSPVCVLTMADEDFVKMMTNKLNPQKAFMMGKMKVRGQILVLYKLFTIWIDAAFKKNRAPEVPFIEDVLLKDDVIPGLKSEIIIFRMIQRLVKNPRLCSEVADTLHFEITKGGKLVSKWKLDFKSSKKCGVFSREPLDVETPSDTTIRIDDQDFALMALNKLNIAAAFSSKRIEGDLKLAPKLEKIFQSPTIRSKL